VPRTEPAARAKQARPPKPVARAKPAALTKPAPRSKPAPSTGARVASALLSLVAIIAAASVSIGAMSGDPAIADGGQRTMVSSPAATKPSVAVSRSVATAVDAVAVQPVRRTTSAPFQARYGIDLSWPQCGTTLPDIALDFAVIGLTDGHASSVNPCLAEQVAWARSQQQRVALYVVPSSPDASTLARASRSSCVGARCVSYRAGVLQARHALRAARAARIDVTTGWWLDVEESATGGLWSADTDANVAVLEGWVATLRQAGARVGVYSTGGYWSMITGGWHTEIPQWVAVGLAGIGAAQQACATPFTGGPVVMTQWLTGPYDGNLLCDTADGSRAAFDGRWHGRTPGVPAILTTPVPHPEIEAQQQAQQLAEQQAAAEAAAEAEAAKHPTPTVKPKPKPKPRPVTTPRPSPSPSPSASPAPAAPSTPEPAASSASPGAQAP
jgi:hypothetical protein